MLESEVINSHRIHNHSTVHNKLSAVNTGDTLAHTRCTVSVHCVCYMCCVIIIEKEEVD